MPNRESAYEILAAREAQAQLDADRAAAEKEAARQAAEDEKAAARASSGSGRRAPRAQPTVVDQVLGNSTAKQLGNTLVKEVTRSFFGTRRR